MSYFVCRIAYCVSRGDWFRISYCVPARWVIGRSGDFGEGRIGFVWVRFGFVFPERGGVVYCHNPLLNRSLSSFLAFRKLGLFGFELGLFWVCFFESGGVVYFGNPLWQKRLH